MLTLMTDPSVPSSARRARYGARAGAALAAAALFALFAQPVSADSPVLIPLDVPKVVVPRVETLDADEVRTCRRVTAGGPRTVLPGAPLSLELECTGMSSGEIVAADIELVGNQLLLTIEPGAYAWAQIDFVLIQVVAEGAASLVPIVYDMGSIEAFPLPAQSHSRASLKASGREGGAFHADSLVLGRALIRGTVPVLSGDTVSIRVNRFVDGALLASGDPVVIGELFAVAPE